MNEFTKISLAGVSFNLENDAFAMLENYISELTGFYDKEDGGKEIISDIEERIAELFIERNGREKVISRLDVMYVIETLGRPSEIENEPSKGERQEQLVRRKLYRDINNKVIGGVLSGTAAYLKTDAVFTRLVYTALSILCFLISRWTGDGMWFWSPIILYLLLCLIMPAAKTVEQRCAMAGITPGINDIKRGKNEMENQEKGNSAIGGFISAVGRILQICIGIILIASGFAGLLAGCAVLFGVEIYDSVPLISALNYISLGISHTIVTIVVAVTYFLICILLLYWGIKCCFKFKSPKWRPGLILFIVCILATIASTALSLVAAKPYYNYQSRLHTTELAGQYDTLYVRIADTPVSAHAKGYVHENRWHYRLWYVEKLDGRKNSLEFTVYPGISINRERYDSNEGPEIKCRHGYFRSSILEAGYTSSEKALQQVYTIKDSLITIYPSVYNKTDKYRGDEYNLYLYIPEECTVKILDFDQANIWRDNWDWHFGEPYKND